MTAGTTSLARGGHPEITPVRHLSVSEVLNTLSPKHGVPMTVNAQDRRFTRAPWRGNVREMLTLE